MPKVIYLLLALLYVISGKYYNIKHEFSEKNLKLEKIASNTHSSLTYRTFNCLYIFKFRIFVDRPNGRTAPPTEPHSWVLPQPMLHPSTKLDENQGSFSLILLTKKQNKPQTLYSSQLLTAYHLVEPVTRPWEHRKSSLSPHMTTFPADYWPYSSAPNVDFIQAKHTAHHSLIMHMLMSCNV